MEEQRKPSFFLAVLALIFNLVALYVRAGNEYVSAVGDPGMRRDSLRLAIESWNQCNEVGEEVPQMGSPRAADCFDIYKASPKAEGNNKISRLLINMFYWSSICPVCILENVLD